MVNDEIHYNIGMLTRNSTVVMTMMETLNLFNSVSLVTLFNINLIVDVTVVHLQQFGILIVTTITSFVIGMKVFDKKDLHYKKNIV